MIYILIAIIFTNSNGVPTSVVAEFTSQQACQVAQQEITRQVNASGSHAHDLKISMCLKKGN